MKMIAKVLNGLLLFLLCLTLSVHATEKSTTVTIKTSAICTSCKARIEKALKATPGVEEANLNLHNKKVRVKYDAAQTSPDQLRTVIANIGYNADNVVRREDAFNKLPGCCQRPGAGH